MTRLKALNHAGIDYFHESDTIPLTGKEVYE